MRPSETPAMGALDQFKADVADARKRVADFEGIVSIRRGDSDGEFSLMCTHRSFGGPLEIQILARDLSSYPKASDFMVFTTTEDVGDAATHFVERLPAWARGKSVQQILSVLSDKLSKPNIPGSAADLEQGSPWLNDLDQPEELSEDDDIDSMSSFDEEDLVLDDALPPRDREETSISSYTSPDRIRRMKKDLTAAKAACLWVGLLPGVKDGVAELTSLSIRISRLGIPAESLEAWGLKASEYAVLLLRFPHGYPTVSAFIKSSAAEPVAQFRLGKCSSPKPSLESARIAFRDRNGSVHGTDAAGVDSNQGALFAPLHVSKSINSLLNEHLAGLLAVRLEKGCGWEVAQSYLSRRAEASHSNIEAEDLHFKDFPIEQKLDNESIITDGAPLPLLKDYAYLDQDEISLPLVAMQFALRRLARCTQYCMNCHRRIHGEFESVKPELCFRELCQYQYLSLGLGVGIEHEIVNNPFVVDLLVSFFHSAVENQKIRALPHGLNLRNYRAGFVRDWKSYTRAEPFFTRGSMTLKPTPDCSLDVAEGDWVVVVEKDAVNDDVSRLGADAEDQDLPVTTCRILSIRDDECAIQTLPQETLLNTRPWLPGYSTNSSFASQPPVAAGAYVFIYHQDIDALGAEEQKTVFLTMANGIRPVLDMRRYLVENPGRPLSSWSGMHGSSLALLNWIVASNRSLIVQDDAVPCAGHEAKPNPDRVTGLGEGWMQFRFAQGSREKEQLFSQALWRELSSTFKNPTLFAWHGSPLCNWHSIIRTGLDFSSTAHGRAYGNGIYLSPAFSTSRCYSGSLSAKNWPNSGLRVSEAISLCEIVNKPHGFVSSSPHYVVNNIGWVQCRYLFVSVDPFLTAESEPFQTRKRTHLSGCYVDQEKGREPHGPDGRRLQIPMSVRPAGRQTGRNRVRGGKGSRNDPLTDEDLGSQDDTDGAIVEDDDIDLLPDVDEGLGGMANSPSGKRRRSLSGDSITETSFPSNLNTPRTRLDTPSVSHPVTAFTPNQLDWDSLPRLPQPTWAASSPAALQRLTRDIRDLHKTQSTTPLPALGWHIDFDKLTNVFHWLVELHSFDAALPLAGDLRRAGRASVVLELRFGSAYPMSPPFVRVVRPRLLPFLRGGGGHVTAGGAVCAQLLTNSGWTPALSLDKVFLEVRLNLTERDPPARLEGSGTGDYGVGEAVAAYRRAAAAHGWAVSKDLDEIAALGTGFE